MRTWLIFLPTITDTWLKQIKSLALLEFLPTDELDDWLMDLVGIDREEIKQAFENDKEEESLFDTLAVFLIIGSVIILLVFLLLILRCMVSACPRVKRCYEYLRSKLFYATFIRFVLMGTLKIQISFGNTLVVGTFKPET